MNRAIYLTCLDSFFLLPILLLFFRAFRPSLMRWWLLVVLVAVLSWLFVNGAVHFYFAYLDDLLIAFGNHPPDQLLETRAADGAKLVFAFFFGWAYGLVYFIPWLTIYATIHVCRRFYRSHNYA